MYRPDLPALRRLVITACSLLASAAALADEALLPTPELIARLREQAVIHEHGQGVPRDGLRAAALYCHAARLGDAASAFDLGWMLANGRGVERNDAEAAGLLHIAANHGVEQAPALLRVLGEPDAQTPACLRLQAAADGPDYTPPPDPPLVLAEVVAEAATEAAAPPEPPEPPLRAPPPVVAIVNQVASEYSVPTPLVWAIMEAESNFNPAAVSPRNAQGLMQLIPATAARFSVRNAFDPAQNIRGGVRYLRWLLAYFEGDVALVAAAYNAGEGAVERHNGVPPYAETRNYVRRIVAAVGSLAQPFDASATTPSPLLERLRRRVLGR